MKRRSHPRTQRERQRRNDALFERAYALGWEEEIGKALQLVDRMDPPISEQRRQAFLRFFPQVFDASDVNETDVLAANEGL